MENGQDPVKPAARRFQTRSRGFLTSFRPNHPPRPFQAVPRRLHHYNAAIHPPTAWAPAPAHLSHDLPLMACPRAVAAWGGAVRLVGALAVVIAIGAGCRADPDGLTEVDALPVGSTDAARDAGSLGPGDVPQTGPSDGAIPGPADAAMADDVPDPELSSDPPPGPRGDPAAVGCADGSREGFADLGRWPRIAGCSGGFRVPGVDGDGARSPHCDREAGNTGANPAGVGCSAADLCAAGWQICTDAGDVERSSPTGCAGAAPDGYALFFLVATGASPDGICVPGAGFENDLFGCGSFGDPVHPSCAPLDRRLDFTGCYATRGLWSCGDDRTHLQETAEVSKAGPGLGGVLCCRHVL
jgi:hypothetical protein